MAIFFRFPDGWIYAVLVLVVVVEMNFKTKQQQKIRQEDESFIFWWWWGWGWEGETDNDRNNLAHLSDVWLCNLQGRLLRHISDSSNPLKKPRKKQNVADGWCET